MLKRIRLLKTGALFENPIFSQHYIDSIHPVLQISTAALEDKALLVSHPAKLVFCNLLNTHSFISPIVIPCS